MKKNRTMKAAAVLLALTLMTSCFVGGTFAKYTSSFNANDTARVANWGFGDATTLDFDLFSSAYDAGEADSTVVSSGGKVIAPGTEQTATFKLNYNAASGMIAPEVDYKIELNVNPTTSIAAVIENNVNIVWSFAGTIYDHAGGTSSWDKMIEAIEGYEETVQANDLPNIAKSGVAVSWQWKFSESPEGDVYDTNMGNAATLESVLLSIDLVATQIGDTP